MFGKVVCSQASYRWHDLLVPIVSDLHLHIQFQAVSFSLYQMSYEIKVWVAGRVTNIALSSSQCEFGEAYLCACFRTALRVFKWSNMTAAELSHARRLCTEPRRRTNMISRLTMFFHIRFSGKWIGFQEYGQLSWMLDQDLESEA